MCLVALQMYVSGQAAPTQTMPAGNGTKLLAQMFVAFSNSKILSQVELNGNATWHAGRLIDSGNVTLKSAQDGSAEMQLGLGALGTRSENQTGNGFGTSCTWTHADGIAHPVSLENCWKPALWFLPAFSLQPSQLGSYEQFMDMGEGIVGSGSTEYRHLQARYILQGTASPTLSSVVGQTAVDLGIDPVTLLPAVMAYSVRPQNSALTPLAIEIHYSDYRNVDGAQVPFHIERYVNGTLQLDITVSSAQLN